MTPSQSNPHNNSDSAGGGHEEDAGGETTPDVLEDASIDSGDISVDSGDTSSDSGDISLDSGETLSEVGPDVPIEPCASLHCGMGAECVAEGNEASCVCLEGLEGPSEQGVCIANPLAFLGLPQTLSGRLGQTLYYTPELLVGQGVFPGEPQLQVTLPPLHDRLKGAVLFKHSKLW
ncbi:MAG: hypothetical protein AAFX99_27775, partial [Myxococcota bacterium]